MQLTATLSSGVNGVRRSPLRPRLYIVAAAVLWSTAGAAIKLCALDGWQISAGRSLIAGLVLLLALREARLRPTLGTLAVGAAYAATVVLFVLANKLTTSANAIFIQDTAPLYVLLASPLLLRERPTRAELFAVPVFLAGLALFFLDQLTPGQLRGNLIALGSGLSFALCIIGLRWLGSRAVSGVVWGNFIAAAVALPFAVQGPSPGALDVGIILFLGIFQLGLSYALFARGLREVHAVEASLLALVEPVLNPVWAFLLAGEGVGPFALAGGAVIIAATAWRTLAAPGADR